MIYLISEHEEEVRGIGESFDSAVLDMASQDGEGVDDVVQEVSDSDHMDSPYIGALVAHKVDVDVPVESIKDLGNASIMHWLDGQECMGNAKRHYID